MENIDYQKFSCFAACISNRSDAGSKVNFQVEQITAQQPTYSEDCKYEKDKVINIACFAGYGNFMGFSSASDVYHYYWNTDKNLIIAGDYNLEQMNKLKEKHDYTANSEIQNSDEFMTYMYEKYGNEIFSKLQSSMDFCSIVFDSKKLSIVAGVTKPSNEYSHLYFGYTKDESFIISNRKEIIEKLCQTVSELPNNSYIVADCKEKKLFTFEGQQVEEKDFEEIIPNEISELTNTWILLQKHR